jgi:hypothetical protein
MSLKSALRRVSHFITFAFGEGDWKLHLHEQAVVDAVLAQLPTAIRTLVLAQIEQAFFIERSSNRISILRFYEPGGRLALADPGFQDRLVKVQMEIDGRKQNAHVTFYKGYIFAVEFKKPRRFYAGKHIVICGVSQGKPGDSYTRSIDRLEHGRPEEDE